MDKYVVGNVLNVKEQAHFLQELKGTKKYHDMLQELSFVNISGSKTDEVVDSFQFDLKYGEEVITGKSMVVKLDNNTSLMYLQRYIVYGIIKM